MGETSNNINFGFVNFVMDESGRINTNSILSLI